MPETSLRSLRRIVTTIIGFLMTGYGLLLAVTNRTRYSLFVYSYSFQRLHLALLISIVGWSLLTSVYGFNVSQLPQRTRRKKR
jgi:hypothetical protein